MQQTQAVGLTARNKWCYSLGGIGRDMTYTLVATFLLVYIQYTMGLTAAQFATIGVILVIGRIWDGVNDPIMGVIIENTRSKWGKFKPWILIGAVLTAVIIVLMFNVRIFKGWNFVWFFAIMYFLWEIAFTMNDISYWSMLASLSSDAKERNSVTTLAVVFAGVGAFLANAVISLAAGDAVLRYRWFSILIAIALVLCQCLTVFGVRQPIEIKVEENKEKDSVSIKKMISTIKNNDQLLWITLAMLLYNIGSGLLTALGYNFIYLELGYKGILGTIFVACFGVSNIGVQCFYPKLANKFGRKKLLLYSFICLGVGYLLLLLLGYVPILPVHIITICLFGIFVFSGQAIFYMILTVNLTNTIEYNDYKTGERNESVVFSLRPFMAKMASALQQLIVTGVLIISGIYVLSQNISLLEQQKSNFENVYYYETIEDQEEYINNLQNKVVIFDEEYQLLLDENYTIAEATEEINAKYESLAKVKFIKDETTNRYIMKIDEDVDGYSAADEVFKKKADSSSRFKLRLTISVLPIIFITISYFVLVKKYIIDEEKYEEIMKSIKERKQQQ